MNTSVYRLVNREDRYFVYKHNGGISKEKRQLYIESAPVSIEQYLLLSITPCDITAIGLNTDYSSGSKLQSFLRDSSQVTSMLFMNSSLHNISTSKDGLLNGINVSFYTSGKIREVGNYKNFQETGIWIFFYENGKIESLGNYSEGLKIGEWLYYNNSGEVVSSGHHGYLWFEMNMPMDTFRLNASQADTLTMYLNGDVINEVSGSAIQPFIDSIINTYGYFEVDYLTFINTMKLPVPIKIGKWYCYKNGDVSAMEMYNSQGILIYREEY